MSTEKLNPAGLLGREANDAAGTALIFGYHLRTVKINGQKAISDAQLKAEGTNLKRWDVHVKNGIIAEIWVPNPPAEGEKKSG